MLAHGCRSRRDVGRVYAARLRPLACAPAGSSMALRRCFGDAPHRRRCARHFGGNMPAEVSTERLFAFLRALRDTGNATLAAEWAGVSRDWAYKRRKQDPWFDALYREMKAMADVKLRPSVSAEDEGG